MQSVTLLRKRVAAVMSKRAVFLDRDGTINVEVNYLQKVEQLELISGASTGIHLLNEAGYQTVVCTNQSAVARGYLSEAYLAKIHEELRNMLARKDARIDSFYYCPHHPAEGRPPYRVKCDCRKPRPGMLVSAARDQDIDLKKSFVIGDKVSDLEAGAAVGCKSILVLTGYGRKFKRKLKHLRLQPAYIAEDILDACRWIVKYDS